MLAAAAMGGSATEVDVAARQEVVELMEVGAVAMA